MKTLIKFLPLILIPLASCVTPQFTNISTDDVYSFGATSQGMTPVVAKESVNTYSTPEVQNKAAVANEQDNTYGEVLIDDDNYYYEDNFKYDDYYDYSYSSRIRRFDNPVLGASYYDSYYTNLYWYDYRPISWGTSIYIGYDYNYYYNPYYSPYYSNSSYYNYSYYSPYNYYWANPYYGYSYWSPYSYGSIYNSGYWAGYYASNYYWSNPYDLNSRYYGPRDQSTASLGRSRSTISSFKSPTSATASTNRSALNSNPSSRVNSTSTARTTPENRGYFSSSRQETGIRTDRNSTSLTPESRSSLQNRTVNIGSGTTSRIGGDSRQNVYNKPDGSNQVSSESRYTFDRSSTTTNSGIKNQNPRNSSTQSGNTVGSPNGSRTNQYTAPTNTNTQSSREFSSNRSSVPTTRYQRPANTNVRTNSPTNSVNSGTSRTYQSSGTRTDGGAVSRPTNVRSESSSTKSSNTSVRSSSAPVRSSSSSSGTSSRSTSSSSSSGSSRSSGGNSSRR
ncbi:MAG TPA: hypothetical protein DCG69_05530 [Bacteroidales bacterium]|nr:hypothetical protein [Bacteroidales bacterium]